VSCVRILFQLTLLIDRQSYGIFLAHYLEYQTFPGATPLHYAFVGGLSISLAMVLAPVATLCVGHFGTKVTLSIGLVLQFLGLMCASWATEIWQLFLTQGVAFGFGMGFLFIASVGVVPQWFDRRRSFANSISTAGSGFGGLTYSLGTNAMIQSIGLGWAFRVLAIVSCGVCLICTILLKDRNKAIGSIHMAFDMRLFKRYEFILLLGWGFFSMLGCVSHCQSIVVYQLILRRYCFTILATKLCDKYRTDS
jgi:MFS family permease